MSKAQEYSELFQLAFVGLVGANNEVKKILKSFHEDHEKPTHSFLFYEFLLSYPLHKSVPPA